MSVLPLQNVLVVAIEQALAAPLATRQLADLGARVIKVERPGVGDFARRYDTKVNGLSSAFVWLNRGKESVELDLKDEGGRQVLDALLRRADVFIHNLSPSAALHLGVDSDSLTELYPRLIAASVSGYGRMGPMGMNKAYDLLIQGETGLMSLTGDEKHPAKVGISIADIAAGMYAYGSILAALYHRNTTGQVLPVELSLFDSLAEWLSYPLYYTMYGGEPPPRTGTNHATIAPYGAFTTGDQHSLLVAVQNDREWSRFCEQVLRQPDLMSDPRFATNESRVEHKREVEEYITACFGRLPHAVVIDRLTSADIAHSRLNPIEFLPEHEQIRSDERWTTTPTEVGPVRTLRPPWSPRGRDEGFGAVPWLGEHTQAVLDWLQDLEEQSLSGGTTIQSTARLP